MKTLIIIFCLAYTQTLSQDLFVNWFGKLGGRGKENLVNITIDHQNNIYLTGIFNFHANFDLGQNPFLLTGVENQNYTFIAKYDADRNLLWAKKLVLCSNCGDINVKNKTSVVVDSENNIFVGGTFENSENFDDNFGITALQNKDIYLMKINSDGEIMQLHHYSGLLNEELISMQIDSEDNIYLYGKYNGTIFLDNEDISLNSGNTSNQYKDIFLFKVSNLGNPIWSKSFNLNLYYNSVFGIDNNNNLNLIANYSDFFSFSYDGLDYNFTYPTNMNQVGTPFTAIALQFNSNGDLINYNNFYFARTSPLDISIDNENNIIVVGRLQQGLSIFDIDNQDSYVNVETIGFTSFVLKLNSNLEFQWLNKIESQYQNYFETLSENSGIGVTTNASKDIYVTGNFADNAYFDSSGDNFLLSPNANLYLWKLNSNGDFKWAFAIQPCHFFYNAQVKVDKSDQLIWAGEFETNFSFQNDVIVSMNPYGQRDIFIIKYRDLNKTSNIEETIGNVNKIYPNPNNGSFNIEVNNIFSKLDIKIYNFLGIIVYKNSNHFQNNDNLNLNLDLKPGIYFLEVNNTISKFIVLE